MNLNKHYISYFYVGCDERYEQENNVPACQAGCGFSFDAASTGLNPPPPPTRPPPPPQQPLIQHGRPSFVSINLPNLLGQINRMMPQIGHMMHMRQQQQESDPLAAMMMMDHHPSLLEEDDVMEEDGEDIRSFLRSNSADSESTSSEEESREDSHEEEEEFPLMMSSSMTAPEQQRPRGFTSFFGRKDDEDLVDPLFGSLFANINQQMNRLMQTMPRVSYLH